MKTRITNKALKERYGNNIIVIPYGGLSHLLAGEEPDAYTAGVYGWYTDIYFTYPAAIQTGYLLFIHGIKPDNKIIKKYDHKAEKILNNPRIKWDAVQSKLKELLNDFINEVVKE